MPVIGEIFRTTNSFEWRINDFLNLPEADECYESPHFYYNGVELYFRIFPNGELIIGYVELDLVKCDGDPISIKFSFALKTVNGRKHVERQYRVNFIKRHDFHPCTQIISRPELVRKKTELLPSDVLTIVFTPKIPTSASEAPLSMRLFVSVFNWFFSVLVLSKSLFASVFNWFFSVLVLSKSLFASVFNWFFSGRAVNISTQFLSNRATYLSGSIIAIGVVGYYFPNIILWSTVLCGISYVFLPTGLFASVLNCFFPDPTTTNASGPIVIHHRDKILHDFKELFLKQENCDVVLRVKGQEFPAHKAILTARSSVFASTFRNNMKEKEIGVVDIEDCDPSIFPDFLCFLYCGDISTLSSENVFGLFTAADKYDISDLRSECVEFMKENLCVETFCETMSLALLHTETELIRYATDFFVENAEQILETVKWQSFVDENPTQSNELFIKYVKSAKH